MRKQIDFTKKWIIDKILVWIFLSSFSLIVIFYWVATYMQKQVEAEWERRMQEIAENIKNGTIKNISQKEEKQEKINVENKVYNNLEEFIWKQERTDEFNFDDDFSIMALEIKSIGLTANIINANGKDDSEYYNFIRKNVALKGSMPRQNWITHLSAHSSFPIYNRLWIQDIFKNLKNVKVWESVSIYSWNFRYIYRVKEVEKRSFENLKDTFSYSTKNKLVIMTCPDYADEDFHTARDFVIAYIENIIPISDKETNEKFDKSEEEKIKNLNSNNKENELNTNSWSTTN